MIGIIIICGASFWIETCTVNEATVVLTAPNVFTDAKACQIDTMVFAEATGLAKPGDVTGIICSYPLTGGRK